ncbi:putative membrane protein [Rhodopirellula europaea 6C]|uniref:Putative membrane protein n=1 Tax=Rhodopirellula europaea 6C TaxID=1263867 RepID=M2B225_9BACT|nr:putative membrane protein [Rhodopirellula europaea 6C]
MHLLTEFFAPHGWVALTVCVLGTSLASYLWAGRGFVLSVLLVGAAYAILDQRWIRSEIDAPGWNGTPDQDAVFYLGVTIRLAFMSVILFATFAATLFFASRFGNRDTT